LPSTLSMYSTATYSPAGHTKSAHKVICNHENLGCLLLATSPQRHTLCLPHVTQHTHTTKSRSSRGWTACHRGQTAHCPSCTACSTAGDRLPLLLLLLRGCTQTGSCSLHGPTL
jgi:hypothetical protein